MQLVFCKFLDENGEPRGRDYTYYTAEPVEAGQYVKVEVLAKGAMESKVKKVIVTQTDVQESDVPGIENFKDKIKTILGVWEEDVGTENMQ
jgi:hypothetical protein